jgi:hypothetical protein
LVVAEKIFPSCFLPASKAGPTNLLIVSLILFVSMPKYLPALTPILVRLSIALSARSEKSIAIGVRI